MRVHFVQRIASLSTNTAILKHNYIFLFSWLVAAFKIDFLSPAILVSEPTVHTCTIMQTNTARSYGIFPSTEWWGHECGSLSPRHGASSGCGWRNGLQYGGLLWINWISSCGQPTRGGTSAWGLDEVLTTPLHKKQMLRINHKVRCFL